MSSNLLNTLHAPSIRVREHSENGWWVVLWELEWKHAQSHSSWEHGGQYAFKGLSENSIRTSGRWPWKHSGEDSGVPTMSTPGQLIVGKERESEQALRRRLKRWHPCQVAVPPSCSSFWRQAEGLAFIQLGAPPPSMFLFVFVIHHKSCVQLVCLLASHIWITLTCRSLLDWKRWPVFPKPPGLEMHAGWNPKPLITAMGIGWLESHDFVAREERRREEWGWERRWKWREGEWEGKRSWLLFLGTRLDREWAKKP